MKQLTTILVCFALVVFSSSSADGQATAYTKKVTYETCELDNGFTSQVIAREMAKEMILNRLADRSESMAELYKFPFSRDFGIPMFACLTDIKAVKEKPVKGGYYYKARTSTDLGALLQRIGEFWEKTYPTPDIVANRESAVQALGEIEQIKAEVSSGDKAGKKAAYLAAVNRLHAADWYEKASFAQFEAEFDQAIDAYTKALEHNPELAGAYQSRGRLYMSHLGDNEKAVADLDRAIRLYYRDAIDRKEAASYQECVTGLDIVLGINKNSPDAYYHRGVCHVGVGKQTKAKDDFVEAAKLGHKDAQTLLTSKGIEW